MPLEYVRIGKNRLKAYERLSRLTYQVGHDIYWLDLYTHNFKYYYNFNEDTREVTIWPDD